VSWAKGFGGGFPIGAIWVDDACAPALGPGTHGSTFGGTPLASVVALAVLEEIENSGALENVKRQEKVIRDKVEAWNNPLVDSLRGVGLMLGFVICEDAMTGVPGFSESGNAPALFLVNKLMDAGMLTAPAGDNVVRWLPRLNVTDKEISEAFDIFTETLDVLSG
jgi:acetylornithine/succinyldiaminopimelate/putrescine aminotransferase